MDADRFDRIARTLFSRFAGRIERRVLLRRAAALGAAPLGRVMLPKAAAAKTLCLKNGSRCKKKGKKCKAGNCLKTPFTIEARWSNPSSDHDTYVFVPNAPGASLPFPYFNYNCRSDDAGDGQLEPFAYVSQDARGPGDEVTTVAFLLNGKYEYWMNIDSLAAAGELTVALRNPNGRVVRSWSSPANPSPARGWHVFDIQGDRKSITSFNRLIDEALPAGAHAVATRVCP